MTDCKIKVNKNELVQYYCLTVKFVNFWIKHKVKLIPYVPHLTEHQRRLLFYN